MKSYTEIQTTLYFLLEELQNISLITVKYMLIV